MSVTTVTGTITATTTVIGTTGAVTNATNGANITIATTGMEIVTTTIGTGRLKTLQPGEAAPPQPGWVAFWGCKLRNRYADPGAAAPEVTLDDAPRTERP